jgi:arabinoxylan arabinofuranohydrolase
MVSDNPLDPDSWEYRGEYVPNEGNFGMGWGNNHTHLHKFNGNYYLFYHSTLLESSMKDKGEMNSDASGYRSIGVNKTTVNEQTQKINKMTLSKTGVSAIKNLDPYQLQQAETMASSGGVMYEDYKNTKSVSKSSLGNDASENLYIKMKAGSWTSVRKVDFGLNGAKSFTLRAKGTGKMEIRNGNSPRTTVATIEFSSTDFEEQSVDIPEGKLKGVKNNLYLAVTEATDFYVDAWQFTEAGASAIQEITNTQHPSPNTRYYDLQGRRLSDNQQHRGIVIEQYTDENGVKHSRKVVTGK